MVSDKRFPRLGSNDTFAFYVWITEAARGGVTRRIITFGWMFPTIPGPSLLRWNKRSAGPSQPISTGEVKVQVVRLSLYAQAGPILSLLESLHGGKTLKEASATTGVSGCPTELLDISLSAAQGQFILRPPVLLPSKLIGDDHTDYCRLTLSPTRASAYCASLILLDKSLLLKNLNIPETESSSAWKTLSEMLEKETGVHLCGPDAGRIGNIEILDFPAGDADGNCQLDFRPIKVASQKDLLVSMKEIDVDISGLVTNQRTFVHCRLRNGSEIILDELKEIPTTSPTATERFSCDEEISVVELTLWRDLGDGRLRLVCDQAVPLVRTIASQLGVQAGSFRIMGAWAASTDTKKDKGKTEKAETTQKISWQPASAVGGNALDPWVPAAISQRELVRRLFPKESGGLFFDVGWEIAFVQWLKETASGAAVISIQLFDPFFDEGGVIHLLAKSENLNVRFEIYTSFQHRASKGVSGKDRVLEECRRLKAVLPKSLRMSEIEPASNSDQQPFHDRYLLVETTSGLKCFSLSNSLQGATRKHPILMLPLPDDLLPRIVAYFNALKSGTRPGGMVLQIHQIWPESKPLPATPAPSVVTFDLLGAAGLLLGKTSIDSESALQDLTAAGFYDTARNHFLLKATLAQTAERMSKALTDAKDLPSFVQTWTLACEILVRSLEKDDILGRLPMLGGSQLVSRLNAVIQQAPAAASPAGTANTTATSEELGLGALFTKGFAEVLPQSEYLLFFRDRGTRLWSLSLATEALLRQAPANLISALESALSTIGQDAQLSPAKAKLLSLALEEVIERLVLRSETALITALFNSKTPLFRALAAQHQISQFVAAPDETGDIGLGLLEPKEHCQALAVLHARLCPPRSPSKSELKRKKTSSSLAATWPKDDEAMLAFLARHMGGRHEWDSAGAVHSALQAVVDAGKLKPKLILKLWCSALLERMRISAGSDGSSGGQFYIAVDGELTQIAAWSLQQLPEADQKQILSEFEKLLRGHLRILRMPFLRENNFREWRKSREIVQWGRAFMVSLRLTTSDVSRQSLAVFLELEPDLSGTVKRFPQDYDALNLAEFIDALTRELDKRTADNSSA